MERFLEGRSALITGSTSGIGLGIARLLAEAGAKVMLNGFGKPEEIAAARADIGRLMGGGDAPYSPADMSKPAEIRAMVAACEAALGACDILIDNAGIQFVSPVEDFPEEKWDAIIAINLSSNFHAIKAALPGCGGAAGGGSSTSPLPTAWSRAPSRRPMSRPSTAWSA